MTVIDIEALARRTGVLAADSAILMGRGAGEAVRRAAGLHKLLPVPLVLRLPARCTVAPAFFVGLLAGSLDGVAGHEDALLRVRVEGGTPVTRDNFMAALAVVIGGGRPGPAGLPGR